MRIRILKDITATFVTTNNNFGAINVEEKEKELRSGQIISHAESVSDNPNGTIDIHLTDGSVIINVSAKTVEQHGDLPTATRHSSNCCKERK